MHLTSEDKRAARDGFAYVVLVGGKRKCYCTKHSEAKAEAGKSGKIVSLGRMRYTTQNPRKRSNPNSSGVEYSWERVAHIDPRVALQDARNALDTISKSRRQGETIRELLKRDAYLRDRFTAALEYLQRRGVVGPLEAERYMSQNPWEAKRPATRYGVTVTNPRKYKHGKAAQLERLILRVSAHGKLTETQLQEILQGIRRAYPAGPKATAQKHIVGLIAKAKEQRIWPKVYNRLARL